MGGPWRERGFDPRALKPPKSHAITQADAASRGDGRDHLARIVVTFIAALATSFGLLIAFMQRGW